jgi:hypothetical protein
MSSSIPIVTPASVARRGTKKERKYMAKLLVDAFQVVIMEPHNYCQDRFITDSVVIDAISQQFPKFDVIAKLGLFDFNPSFLNRNVLLSFPDAERERNSIGLFRHWRTYDRRPKTYFYYSTLPGSRMGKLPGNNDADGWEALLQEASEPIKQCMYRNRNKKRKVEESDDLRRKIDDSLLVLVSRLSHLKKASTELSYSFPTYWESSDARKLFLPKVDEGVEDALERRVKLLTQLVSNSDEEYSNFLPGDGDPNGAYTEDRFGKCSRSVQIS